jgi:uncharacterized protein YqjF (DUF2071 family)
VERFWGGVCEAEGLEWEEMIRFLRRHPFPVVARFDRVVALSFAFREEVLRPLVPEGLELDAYEGFGFLTVAMVWTRGLRPAGFPEVLGRDFFLAGYRIFTRLRDGDGRRLRGLRILRSETDRRGMVWAGNLMTAYNYRLARVRVEKEQGELRVETFRPSGERTLRVVLEPGVEPERPPEGSPFPDWRTARRFAGPMPFTFSPAGDGKFVVIEGGRSSWQPRPVAVSEWEVGFFSEGVLRDQKPVLANAFVVEDVEFYRWEKGRMVRPGGGA